MSKTPPIEALPLPLEPLSLGQINLRFVHITPGDPTRDFVPAYHFRIITADGSDAGHINFRVGDTQHVLISAGHIGFEIHPSHRGHRYALQACQAIAPFVRTFYTAVTITCNPDNLGSRLTIERLGAIFIDQVPVPPHDPHYERGTHSMLRYRWVP